MASGLPDGVVSASPVRYPVIWGADGKPLKVISPEGELPFPSGAPMIPRLTGGGPPRGFVPAPWQNLVTQPRRHPGIELTPFQQLRALANFDLVRIIMEDLKGQVRGSEFQAVPTEGYEDCAKTSAFKKQRDTVRRWMDMPDPIGRLDWDDWVGIILEETLVTDALTLCPRRTITGDPLGLEVLDGEKILPLVDSRGKPPAPPSPAYQQIAHGFPERNFFTHRSEDDVDDELWYLVRNRRATTLYGYAEVERVLMTTNLAMRNQLHDLNYYTTGTMPDGLFSFTERSDAIAPRWTAEQLKEFEQTFSDMLSGRSDRRAGGIRFVPDGKLFEIKNRVWDYEFIELLARIIAWAFNVSPAHIMKNVGRNPIQTLEQSTLESGSKPLAKFVGRIATRYVRYELGFLNIKIEPDVDEAEDPSVVFQRNVAYVSARDAKGKPILLSDEVRDDLGMDALPDADFKSPEDMQLEQAKIQAEASGGAGAVVGGQRPPSAVDPHERTAPVPAGVKARQKELKKDLGLLRKVVIKTVKAGKDPVEVIKAFKSTTITKGLRDRLIADLGGATA